MSHFGTEEDSTVERREHSLWFSIFKKITKTNANQITQLKIIPKDEWHWQGDPAVVNI